MNTFAATLALTKRIHDTCHATGAEMTDGLAIAIAESMLSAISEDATVRAEAATRLSDTSAQRSFDRMMCVAAQVGLYAPPRPALMGELRLGRTGSAPAQTVLVSFDEIDPARVMVGSHHAFSGREIEGVPGRASVTAWTESIAAFDRFVHWAERERRVLAIIWAGIGKEVAA